MIDNEWLFNLILIDFILFLLCDLIEYVLFMKSVLKEHRNIVSGPGSPFVSFLLLFCICCNCEFLCMQWRKMNK